MTDRRWFTANERAAYRRRVALEREATELIRAADRRQDELALSRPRRVDADKTQAMPWRLTLSDLPLLRKKGLVP
jgi:hypothetical protein